jgi:hypothetical protein
VKRLSVHSLLDAPTAYPLNIQPA